MQIHETAVRQLSMIVQLKTRQHTHLSQPAQSVGQRRVAEVPLCQLRHQLLKLAFKELAVGQQRLLAVRPVAEVVSLERRGAQHQRCVL